MEILTVRIDGVPLAFAARQIDQILPWPSPTELPVIGLRDALDSRAGGMAPADTGRVLVCGAVGFLVPDELQQQHAERSALFQVPVVLSRLNAPPWLAGFYLRDAQISSVVDLRKLAALVSR